MKERAEMFCFIFGALALSIFLFSMLATAVGFNFLNSGSLVVDVKISYILLGSAAFLCCCSIGCIVLARKFFILSEA